MYKKLCYVCKKLKPINEFGTHKGRPDGKRAECKECIRTERKEGIAELRKLKSKIINIRR